MKITVSALLIALAACTPLTPPPMTSSADGVRFGVERVSPGAMLLTLDSGASHSIGYNLCHSALERLDGKEWTNVPTDEVCTMELRTLAPGRDATFEKRLPAGLAPGTYRYITRIESPLGTEQKGLATDPFRVP